MLPVEAFATRIKIVLITWSSPLKLLIFTGQRSNWSHTFLIFTVRWLPWSLYRLSKRALIIWFNLDPGCKCFYTWTEFDKLGPRNLCTNIQLSSHWINIVVSLDNLSSTNRGMMKNDIISFTIFHFCWLQGLATSFPRYTEKLLCWLCRLSSIVLLHHISHCVSCVCLCLPLQCLLSMCPQSNV